jgi:signal peptidase
VLLLVFLVGSVAGFALGQPVLFTYVETDSMSPTLEPGDGFVAIPVQLSGDIDTGDVIVFRAKHLHGGGLVTHRVIGESSDGYVTRGDANPFPDQTVGEPPVSRDRIVATALQVNGNVVVVPNLGTYATTVRQSITTSQRRLAVAAGTRLLMGPEGLVLLGSFVVILLTFILGRLPTPDKPRNRDIPDRDVGTDPRLLIGMALLLVVAASTVSMASSARTNTYEVRMEKSELATYKISNGLFPTTVIIERGETGVTTNATRLHLNPRETQNISVWIFPQPGGVGATRTFSEYRYPSVLPATMLEQLHEIHRGLAIVAVDLVFGSIFYIVGHLLLGTKRIRFRSRDAPSRLRLLLNRLL